MNTTTGPGEGALTLFGEPQPAATRPRGRGTRPDPAGQDPEPSAGEGAEVFDPSRWVMIGWRCGCWRCGPGLTREQTASVINTPRGPCAHCGTLHHRYGEGGGPLCPACRTPSVTKE